MPFPSGVENIGGPLLDASASDIAATPALRDFGAISLRGGMLRRVNAAGDAWVDIPGWVVADTEPTNPFRGHGLV